MARRLISIAAVAAVCSCFGLTVAKAPDTSLDTTPVAYYGANWNRSQVNIDQLAKMQMVSELHCCTSDNLGNQVHVFVVAGGAYARRWSLLGFLLSGPI